MVQSDNFWLLNRVLSEEEVEEIKSLSLADIIKQVTSIADDDIQNQVFEWKAGDPCAQPLQLNASNLEQCPHLKGYDYFQVRSDLNFRALFDALNFAR